MSAEIKHFYEFADYRFDAEKRILWRDGEIIALAPKASEVLSLLIENRGNLVEREEILERVWRDTFVEEGVLNNAISALRKTLGTSGMIQTVPRRGYRFTAEVSEVFDDSDADLIIERQTVSQTLIEEFSDDAPDAANNEEKIINADRLSSTQNRARKKHRLSTDISARPRYRTAFVSAILIVSAFAVFIAFGGWQYVSSKRNPDFASHSANEYKSFADGNRVLTDFGFPVERAQAVAVQADGKIVVGGWVGENLSETDFALARYNADGTLDPAFDGDGKVTTPLGKNTDQLYGLAIQPDGKIIAVGAFSTGANSRRFAVLRYKPDGALDAGFNEDGIVALELGNGEQDTAYAAHVLADSKILVVGSALMVHNTGKLQIGQNDFAVVRLNADGSLDTTFGDNGKTITDSGSGSDVAYALALQTDGKILVGGMMAGGRNQNFGLARYNADGSLDTTFGTGGKVRTDFYEEGNIIWSLALQADGKIIAGGWASKAGTPNFAIARYDADGSLDNSFNGNGKLVFDIEGGGVGREIFVEPDGRIFIGGRSGYGSETDFGFGRVFADGRMDESFNNTGKASISFQKPIEAHGMILTADGFAVAVGTAGDNKSSDFAVARVAVR